MINVIIFICALCWSVFGTIAFVRIIEPVNLNKVNKVKLVFLSVLCGPLVVIIMIIVGIFEKIKSMGFNMKEWLET